MIQRPAPGEYGEFASGYIARVPEGDFFHIMQQQLDQMLALLSRVTEEFSTTQRAPGKWNLKQELAHLIDGERIFAVRAVYFWRNDPGPMPNWDQDLFGREWDHTRRSWTDLVEEFTLLRKANILQFRTLTHEESLRKGTASGVEGVTVRGVLYSMVGHAQHHLDGLRQRQFGAHM